MRHFSVEEAQQALPDVARRVERMIELRTALLAVQPSAEDREKHGRTNGSAPLREQPGHDPERATQLRRELMSEIEALEGLGVLVKDVETGLVDFPCTHPTTGDTVYLCWQSGEETIAFWHARDAGYAGRKPLPFT